MGKMGPARVLGARQAEAGFLEACLERAACRERPEPAVPSLEREARREPRVPRAEVPELRAVLAGRLQVCRTA